MKKAESKTAPKEGSLRITHDGRYWSVEEYSSIVTFMGKSFRSTWWPLASARTLWGIRRQWKRIFGERKPFPLITCVYWQEDAK